MTKQVVALATAALTILSASASLAADPAMGGKMGGSMMHGKMMGKDKMMHGVYACKMCKMYYTPMQAKTMGYKDSMGHKLTMMAKAPAGYKMGGSMKGGMKGGMMKGGAMKSGM